MKNIIDKFREYLTEGNKEDYVEAGEISLYHYAPVDSDKVTIDPRFFSDKATRSTFSRNEYEISTTPRTFWYVDPKQRERMVVGGRSLYTLTLPADRIYNFKKDPEGYMAKHRHETYGLRKGMEWNVMLEDIRERYDGVFYSVSFDVVSLFTPQIAHRVSEEDRARLESD